MCNPFRAPQEVIERIQAEVWPTLGLPLVPLAHIAPAGCPPTVVADLAPLGLDAAQVAAAGLLLAAMEPWLLDVYGVRVAVWAPGCGGG
jgi:hypothetical protein